jgi:hypothetical protein
MQMRQALKGLAEDRHVESFYASGILREFLSHAEVLEAVRDVCLMHAASESSENEIHADLFSRLQNFIFVRETSRHAGQGISNILKQLAPIVVTYLRLTREDFHV